MLLLVEFVFKDEKGLKWCLYALFGSSPFVFLSLVFADEALKRCPYWRLAARPLIFAPCFFFLFCGLIPLLLAAESGKSDISVLRCHARCHKSFRRSFGWTLFPTCCASGKLDCQRARAASDCEPLSSSWAAKNISFNVLPYALRFAQTNKASSAHLPRDSFFGICCKNFWNDTKLKPRYACCQLGCRKLYGTAVNKDISQLARRCCAGCDHRCEAECVGVIS